MAYKRHTTILLLRLLLILVLMMCIPFAAWLMEPRQLIFTYLGILIILVALVLELNTFLGRTVGEMTRFLEHIRNRDFSLRFNEEESWGNRKNLYRTFNEVLGVYRDIRIEREVQFRFLEHIVELIEIGIIVFDQSGNVVLSNTAATDYTGIPILRSWKQLSEKNPDFALSVGQIEMSCKVLIESKSEGIAHRMMVQVSRIRMLEETCSLMTIQDVKGVVEEKETGAWIRLLSTLNHEIKNSVTPISSLADTIMMILEGKNSQLKPLEEIDQQNLSDVYLSVKTLRQRSKSLLGFIGEYHKLTRIPAPDPEDLICSDFLKETAQLYQNEGNGKNTDFVLNVEENISIRADRGLMEQVLINLIKNSMESFQDQSCPRITISCKRVESDVVLEIADNGAGIDSEILEDIFIPFFSTKSQGSGIGLSLVRQIIRLHGGDVRILSNPGDGTRVSLFIPSQYT